MLNEVVVVMLAGIVAEVIEVEASSLTVEVVVLAIELVSAADAELDAVAIEELAEEELLVCRANRVAAVALVA